MHMHNASLYKQVPYTDLPAVLDPSINKNDWIPYHNFHNGLIFYISKSDRYDQNFVIEKLLEMFSFSIKLYHLFLYEAVIFHICAPAARCRTRVGICEMSHYYFEDEDN